MSVLIKNSDQQQQQNTPSRFSALAKRWGLYALVATGLTLIYYFVIMLSNAPAGFFLLDPTQFYREWQAAGTQLLAGQLPLKLPATSQPLLETSAAPLFYPGSLIYYLAGSVVLFKLAHFWWLAFWYAKFVIGSRRQDGQFWVASAVLLLSLGFLGALRPDWLAAVAWLPAGIALSRWRKKTLAWLLLPFPLGLIWLAAPLPLAGGLSLAILAAWLWVAPTGSKTKTAWLGLLALTGGIFLAGPQLFPRLGYAFGAPTDLSSNKLPISLTLGAYAAFLGLISQILLGLVVGWVRFYREDDQAGSLRRVLKNSATPLFAQLSGRVIDFGYAIFLLRFLGPEGNGEYAFAVTSWLFFATICDFGLESIVTREIARARSHAETQSEISRLFITKLGMRLVFSVAALPISLLWLGAFNLTGTLSAASGWALILLMIGFWPSAVAGSITAVFRGYEKFEYLAAGQLFGGIVKVPIGIVLLLLGWGVVGLAAASVIVNFLQVILLDSLMRRYLFTPQYSRLFFDWQLGKRLLAASFPLLLNGLIINILFKSDGLLIQAFRGSYELGIYNSAYKFIDALLIIPSTLTMALFPLFSHYGESQRDNLLRAYREGLRFLLVIALPISGGTLFVAHDLIGFLGGKEFLPDGAIALQILIWFLPFSYLNGLTQYVLVALNKQRNITGGIVFAAVANIVLNMIFIPIFGYSAAAALTIVTELLLLVPFCYVHYKTLGKGSLPLLQTFWRPTLATGLMMLALGGLLWLGFANFLLTVVVGGGVYLAALILLGGVTKQDVALLKKALKR